MKIIKHREREESTSYTRQFDYEDRPGAGFGFDCDEHGNVDVDKLNSCARKNYEDCVRGHVVLRRGAQYVIGSDAEGESGYVLVPGSGYLTKVKMIDLGVQTYHHSYVHPAVGECACGAHVELDRFTNTCHKCGRDYNSSGQLLAPRVFWGEETGESVSDILAIDADPRRHLDFGGDE